MEYKICTNCRLERPIEEFQKNSRYKDGFSTWCKPCHKEASTKSRTRMAAENPDYHKNNALKHKHHLTLEQYSEKLKEQGEHCALCPSIPSNNGERLGVDHDHTICPGKYACYKCRRGLLCSTCNARLGYLEQQLMEFPSSTRDQAEVYLRNTVAKDSWTYAALRYLRSYKRTQSENKGTQNAYTATSGT